MNASAASTLIERAVAVRQVAHDGADVPGVPQSVPSPCVSICRMDAASGFCEGCLRSLDEIARWSRAGDADKRSIWRAIELRAEAGFCIVADRDKA